jgi:uncharacterized membrane protein
MPGSRSAVDAEVSASRVILAVALILVGAQGFLTGDFNAFWIPAGPVPAHKLLADLCAGVSMAAGTGLLWRRSAPYGAGLLLILLSAWLLLLKAPVIVRAPLVVAGWESGGEVLVMIAGALGLSAGGRARLAARILCGIALLAFGTAHLAYVQQTAALVPAWLPSPTGWVWFTGAAYLAAGLALLTGILARWAAMLMVAQMGLFTLLVWAPAVMAHPHDTGQWSELLDSGALTAAVLVAAAGGIAREDGLIAMLV